VTAENVAIAQRNRSPEQLARQVFQLRDTNGDRRLSRREFPSTHSFDEVDTNKDGSVTLKEEIGFRRARLKRAFEQRRQIQAPLPEGAVAHRDLVYAKIGEREMPLDIYLPKSDDPLPVVMWVHGGAWRVGGKGNAGPARILVDHGYAVVDVEYRLSGEAIFPAQIQDCKAAVRWIRANAKKYSLDADRIGVWGSSAGGHLVALLGTSGDIAEFETESNADFSSRRRRSAISNRSR
jgi:acetyl esterase/lipase